MTARFLNSAIIATMLATAPCSANDTPSPAEGVATITRMGPILAKRITDATRTGAMPPRFRAVADAALIRSVFNPPVIRSAPLDVGAVLAMCGAINQAEQAYILYGVNLPSGVARPVAEQRRLSAQLEDEFVAGMVSMLICTKRAFEAIEPFMASLSPAQRHEPARIGGADKIRAGAIQIVNGLLLTQSDPTLRPGSRAAILDAALEMGDVVSPSLGVKDRTVIRAEIDRYLPRAAATAIPKLKALRLIYAASTCNTICEMAGG